MIDNILEEGNSEFDRYVDDFVNDYKENGNIHAALSHATSQLEFKDRARPIASGAAAGAVVGGTLPFHGDIAAGGMAAGGIIAAISAAKYVRNRANDDRIHRFQQYVGSQGVVLRAKNDPSFALHINNIDKFAKHVKQSKNALNSARVVTQGSNSFYGKGPLPLKRGGVATAGVIPHGHGPTRSKVGQWYDRTVSAIANGKKKPNIVGTGKQPQRVTESILDMLIEGEVIQGNFGRKPSSAVSTTSAEVIQHPMSQTKTKELVHDNDGNVVGERFTDFLPETGIKIVTTKFNQGKGGLIFSLPHAMEHHYDNTDHILEHARMSRGTGIMPGSDYTNMYTTIYHRGRNVTINPIIHRSDVPGVAQRYKADIIKHVRMALGQT